MNRFNDILCVLEADDSGVAALQRAVTLAQSHQAALTVMGIAERIPQGIHLSVGDDVSSQLQQAVRTELSQVIEERVSAFRNDVKIQVKVELGTPFLQIIREVERNGHDLVIKAPERLDWLDRLFGGDDMHLLRKCPCPVWMVKSSAPSQYRRILAAVDVDDLYSAHDHSTHQALNRIIVQLASGVALAEAAELHIVHVWDAIGERLMSGGIMGNPEIDVNAYVQQTRRHHDTLLRALLRELEEGADKDSLDYIKPKTHLLKGKPAREIIRLATELEVDLLVLGTLGRTGIPGLIIGNTAETVLAQIDCSVLAIKPPGFRSPIEPE